MTEMNSTSEPDWDTPVTFTLTPTAVIHTIYATADTVHTGWESCVDRSLAVAESTVLDEDSDNHCRLAEQEYVEDEMPDITWHDWTVELKIAEVYITGHWRAQVAGSPSDWEWCTGEAENAFSNACLLLGRKVRRGLMVEEPSGPQRAPKTRH